jgi:hypothetical protein
MVGLRADQANAEESALSRWIGHTQAGTTDEAPAGIFRRPGMLPVVPANIIWQAKSPKVRARVRVFRLIKRMSRLISAVFMMSVFRKMPTDFPQEWNQP